jgi:hypothetical protein
MAHPRVLIPVLLVLLSCTSGDRAGAGSSSAWVAERDTIGDTVVVRTLRGGIWGPPAELVERVSIGVLDGPEELMLGNVRGIAVTPAGIVHVLESEPALKQFAADGRYLRTIGRVGSGPGEYRRPDGGIAVLPGDRIVIRDPGNGRMSVFGPDGEPLGTWRISGSFSTSRRLYNDRAGNVYTLILLEDAGDPADWKLGLQRFSPDGTPGDSIAAPRWEFDRAIIKSVREGGTSVSDVPFSASAHWTFSPLGYMVGGVSGAYRIELLKDGAPLRIERQRDPVPVAPDEAADHRRAATENMRRNVPGWVWNGPDIPDEKPPFRGIFAAEDGRIWVLLSMPGAEDLSRDGDSGAEARGYSMPVWTEPVAFDVYEADGRYLGEVRAPAGFLTSPEPVFRGDTVWAAAEDAEGVRYVKRYQVALGDGPSR